MRLQRRHPRIERLAQRGGFQQHVGDERNVVAEREHGLGFEVVGEGFDLGQQGGGILHYLILSRFTCPIPSNPNARAASGDRSMIRPRT